MAICTGSFKSVLVPYPTYQRLLLQPLVSLGFHVSYQVYKRRRGKWIFYNSRAVVLPVPRVCG